MIQIYHRLYRVSRNELNSYNSIAYYKVVNCNNEANNNSANKILIAFSIN